MKNKVIVFDLDDTLYNEIDFLISAYKEISKKISTSLNDSISETDIFHYMYQSYSENKNPFNEILLKYKIENISIDDLLNCYRNHIPKIKLHIGVDSMLKYFKENKFYLGLITDGRSVQQRNKIRALDIEKYFDGIIVSEEFGSEKPDIRNFKFFDDLLPNSSYIYIADNPKKDFIAPNKLGWKTICLLDNGRNIHKQNFEISKQNLPNIYVKDLKEIMMIVSEF